MIKKKFCFVCDNPFCDHVKNPFIFHCYSFAEARQRGWVISHDRKSCYCPACANDFKYCGRNGNFLERKGL